IRVGELVKLRTGYLSSQGRQHYLRVRGKGEGVSCRSRASTRGSAATATAAAEGRRVRRPLRGPQAAAGEPGGAYELLTDSGVQQLVRNLARMAGIEWRVYPHLLRHSYITWAIRRGMHPMQIRQIVGHESTAMIDRVYTHLVPQDAYAAMVKALADVEEDWRISFGSTSDRIRIREANQADTRRLVDVHHRTVLVAYAGIFPPNSPEPRPDALQRQWELAFTDPTFRALLAEEDQGGAVATVAVRSDPDISGSGELCRLHVLPGWWGSGVGTVLHDAALTALRTAGYAQAGLWVLRD